MFHGIIVPSLSCSGVVEGWAALIMGVLSGSIPWFTMMVVHKRSKLLQKVDDTMAVFHTHAIAGTLGGLLTGLFADPRLNKLFYGTDGQYVGFFYGWDYLCYLCQCYQHKFDLPLH